MRQVKHELSLEPVKVAKLTEKDASEYNRIRLELIRALEKLGGYVAAVDDVFIDEIAVTAIYSRKVEHFLDSPKANEHTYAGVTDTKLKFLAIIEKAMRQLALTRRDRVNRRSEANLMAEFREALVRGLKDAGQ